jgi:outer membrane protein, heavy metal efflux system
MKAYTITAALILGLAAELALPVAAMAQAAPPGAGPVARQELTEAEVVAAVLSNSLSLEAARTGAAAAATGPAQVRWPFPMVEVMPMVGALRDGEAGAQVMARQTIPWPGRLAADRNARTQMAAAAGFETHVLALELATMARMAYAELWGIQERSAQIAQYRTQLELYREAALAQYAAGRGPQQAVLGIQLEAGMLAQRLEALAEERSPLAAQIGALSGGRLRIAEGDRLAAPSQVVVPDAAALRNELDGHPMLEAGRAMVAAEQSMADMNRTMLRPDFTVGANLNLSRMAFDRMYGLEPVMPAVGVMLPLWRGGVRARIQESELRATQREIETADARLLLEAQLQDVMAQLWRVRGRIATYEGSLRPEIRQTLEASMAGYQAGTIRFLELLDAQRMALELELDLIMARVREAELAARLDAATGRLAGGSAAPSGSQDN